MKPYIYAKYIYKVILIKECNVVIHLQEFILYNNDNWDR